MISNAAEKADWILLELRAKELFSPAAPIDAVDLFAGRKDQIQKLLDAVTERGRHAILYGERGVGKTSLAKIVLMIIGKALNKKILGIRKQVSPIDDYNTLWRKAFRDIQYTITTPIGYGREEVSTKNISEAYGEKLTPDDVVRELGKIAAHVSPVLIFDEFDQLDNIQAKQLMSHTIKALSDSGVNATIVIVGMADDINTLVEEHKSVKRNILEIKMPRMSTDELNDILKERLPELDIGIQGDARWKIITLSRGLPEYVHALGRNAAVNAIREQRKQILEVDVNLAIKQMLSDTDQSANNAYKKAVASNQANALYQQVLLACALTETDSEGKFTLATVVQPLSKILNRKIEIANFQARINALCTEERGQILEKLGIPRAYKYRFKEPKMQPYVIMQGISVGTIGEEALKAISAPEQLQLRLSNDF